MSLRFGQSCPTCGRRIKIRMEFLGRTVACPHCRAEFNATDKQPRQGNSEQMLMQRVERALRQAEDPAFTE
ncbi:hypothetical protein FF011L_28420 [Roseimaritima multifibrata]|uniref:Uncharacterized protein n=1 Tax=Roseimaritima multifibrata TaxID=1930274 RepID=A0A517MGP7_9BACT|nr:hypothetical protein FF011L_28420 [Roseimaritima multifibrata]